MAIPVVAYYTKDTPYAQDAAVLKQSLDCLDIPHHLVAVDDLGSWQANTQQKATFIRDFMNLHQEIERFVYIDVDAFVIHPLTYFEMLASVTHFAATTYWGGELLSGTMYMRNSQWMRDVVDRWCEINEAYPETLPDGREAWDQRTLLMAINEAGGVKGGQAFLEVPHEYCWIIGMTSRQAPGLDPVVVHTRGHYRANMRAGGRA